MKMSLLVTRTHAVRPCSGVVALVVLSCLSFVRSSIDSNIDSSVNNDLQTEGLHLNLSVLRIHPKSQSQLKYLRKLEQKSNDLQLDFWKPPSHINHSVDVMVNHKHRRSIEQELFYRNIEFDEMIESVESLIHEEQLERLRSNLHYESDFINPLAFFRNYNELERIYDYLNQLEKEFPKRVSIETIGHSFERRPLRLIKIGEPTHENKKIVWIDGGIHAREWISPATAMYIADQLAREADRNEDIRQLIEKFDFYILPVINPDGYKYTFTNHRLWRKTRSIRTGLFNAICYGADPNRNFGYHWGEVGSSLFPCSQVYAGPYAFSEPETQAMAKKIMSIKEHMVAYFALHSYSQLILMPWGYTHKLPTAYWDMEDKAKKARDRLSRKFGTSYSVGSSTNVLYAAAGGADDWVHGVAKVKYTFTIELRDQGNKGFLLPPSQILPTGEETFDAICNMTAEIGQEHQIFIKFNYF